MVDLPVTLVDLPCTMVHLPNTMVDLPNIMVDLPNTMVYELITRLFIVTEVIVKKKKYFILENVAILQTAQDFCDITLASDDFK